ncbi:Ribonucleoside-diphosphate reductase [Aphis craccivora]|uniref:Ribonucleoside-diphosphate reductase n=1 Tax=Aphis craccivora TaxID=307492 RepID=A0A6G0W0U2_APHCR|nr:Ribonucleoside-diphosphate reductase [Aphis craccivora]
MAVRKKSNNHCSVYGCNTYYFSDKSISFHQLPNRNEPKILHKNNFGIEELVDRRRIWEIVLKLTKAPFNFKGTCYYGLIKTETGTVFCNT